MREIYIDIEREDRNQALMKLVGKFQEEKIKVWFVAEMVGKQETDDRSEAQKVVCGVQAWTGSENFEDGCLEKQRMKHACILTVRQKMAEWAMKHQIACVGYEPPGTAIRLLHIPVIVQGFEDLDVEFFRRIYQRQHGIPWVIARTDRLVVRESIPEDFEALYGMYQEPGMTDYMKGMEEGREEERQLFEKYIQYMYAFYSYGMWSILEKKSGRIVGRAGLENGMYQGEPILEVGYMIGRREQKMGYGTEALKAVLRYGFEELKAEEIYGFAHAENRSSRKMLEKEGFVLIGKAEKETEVFVYKKLVFQE